MAANSNKKKLLGATVIFWILLLYIIAALIWWFISLQHQTIVIYQLKKDHLSRTVAIHNPAAYRADVAQIEKEKQRATAKNISEGVTFLLLIMVGAVFLYRSVRRQFRLQQQQQNFMMAITHELKTPISITRLNLETLQKYQLTEQQKQKLLQVNLQETARLDSLINNILISAQLEGGAYPAAKENLNFSALVNDVVKQFSNRYPGRTIVAAIEPDMDINGDPLLLKLLVSNLLENANKYSEKETPVTCKLYMDSNIKLQVMDEGIGIADDEKPFVFQQFYRIGNEQTRNAKGTGLGLYISKKIADAHRATITISGNKPQGSIFTVIFSV